MQRKIYLDMHTLAEAQQLFWSRFTNHVTGDETIASRLAIGRVTRRTGQRPLFLALVSFGGHGRPGRSRRGYLRGYR